MPGGLQALNQLDVSGLDGCKVWVWVWLEASRFLQMPSDGGVWLDASIPERVDLSGPCKVWAGSACFCFEMFGFGSGWRPLVASDQPSNHVGVQGLGL